MHSDLRIRFAMTEKTHRTDHQPVFLLANVPWRESSLRIEAFSRDCGRVSLLARSARKRQSELRGVLVPFVPVSASWYGSAELKTLHRAEWLGGWALPQGRALFSGMYANELVLKLTAREDPHPGIFHAMFALMRSIAAGTDHAAALRRFEWALLTELGFAPDLRYDGAGSPVEAGRQYWLRPEHAVLPLEERGGLPAEEAGGMALDGGSLLQLAEGEFGSNAALHDALKLTRMLIDFRLPQGVRSRRILQQMQAFPMPV